MSKSLSLSLKTRFPRARRQNISHTHITVKFDYISRAAYKRKKTKSFTSTLHFHFSIPYIRKNSILFSRVAYKSKKTKLFTFTFHFHISISNIRKNSILFSRAAYKSKKTKPYTFTLHFHFSFSYICKNF